MALILIDVFTFPSIMGGGSEVYEVYFDNAAIALSITYSGTDGVVSDVSILNRGRANGDPITSVIGILDDEGNGFVYTLYSDTHTPFATIGEPVPIDPTPPACDLSITTVVTNETGQSLDNGTIEATANSSFGTRQVSIDNVNWFTSPHTFIDLPPANYTIYARDANGCETNVTKSIEAFNNPIAGGFAGGLPVVEVSAGNVSKWNAAFNPIVINFQTVLDPLKKNFRIEIEITSQNGVVVGTWSPNTLGFTRADISGYLRSLVNAKDQFKYDVINWRDIDRSASYTIRYREVWDGDSSAWYVAPYPMYVTWSAKQLQELYGGNMAEYVTFSTEPNPSKLAKWLTLFQEPTAWVGLPYDNSFILSEYVVDEFIKVRTTSLDINRQPVSSGILNSFLLNNDAGYIVADTDVRLIIQQAALPPVANDGIFEQLGINRLMLAGTPAVGVEYFVIQLYTGDDATPNYITQPLTIKINRQCTDPYVYIKWLNTLGGWDYWRFGHDQVASLATTSDIEIDRNVFDWENSETIADTIKKSAVKKISFGANISDVKLSGLLGLATSTHVMMMSNLNPLKWQTVILQAGTFDIKRTKLRGAELKFTISLPQINIQQQ
jgi:hypothetical protein